MLRGPHWEAQPAEIKPWAKDAADLLGRMPVGVAERAIDASAAVTVAVGLGTMVSQRRVIDRVQADAQRRKAAPASQNATATRRNTRGGTETPETAKQTLSGDPDAPKPGPVHPEPVSLNGILE